MYYNKFHFLHISIDISTRNVHHVLGLRIKHNLVQLCANMAQMAMDNF